MIYAMVKNVVNPALISVMNLAPFLALGCLVSAEIDENTEETHVATAF